jgi:hypothetical protein
MSTHEPIIPAVLDERKWQNAGLTPMKGKVLGGNDA